MGKKSIDDGSELTPAELEVRAAGLIRMRAPSADTIAAAVNGTEYHVDEAGEPFHVQPRDVAALEAHGFVRA